MLVPTFARLILLQLTDRRHNDVNLQHVVNRIKKSFIAAIASVD